VEGLARSYQFLSSNIKSIERLCLSPLFYPFIGTVFAINSSEMKGLQKCLTSLRKIDKGCGVLSSVDKHSFFFDKCNG
jgi:hypothetical protein